MCPGPPRLLLQLLVVAAVLASNQPYNVTVGYLAAVKGNLKERQGITISGAISYAIEEINKDPNLLPGVQLLLEYVDTQGDENMSTRATSEMLCRGVSVFIGPEGTCNVESVVAGSWNIPMISYKCSNARRPCPATFARTEPPDSQVIHSVAALLRYYNWRKFSIVTESVWYPVAEALVGKAPEYNLTGNITTVVNDWHKCCEEFLDCCSLDSFWYNNVMDTKTRTRIYVFLGSHNTLRSFMQAMNHQNLFEKGEYMVITVDMMPYEKIESSKYFWSTVDSDGRTESKICDMTNMMKMAQSLLVVVLTPPSENYETFTKRVREYGTKEPFNFNVPSVLSNYKMFVSIYAAYLYDAVQLYAKGLSLLLHAKGSNLTAEEIEVIVKDGKGIIDAIKSLKNYTSITGASIKLDSCGDSEGNFSVLALTEQPEMVAMKAVNCNYILEPVGTFQRGIRDSLLEYKMKQRVIWAGPDKPEDEPSCGFNYENCAHDNQHSSVVAAAVLGVLLFCALVVTLSIYRKWKIEQEIEGLLWKIEPAELNFGNDIVSSPSKTSLVSANSFESRCGPQWFAKTIQFRNTRVRVKELKFSKKKDINREIMKEMRILRDFRHDNINSFIGACIEPMRVIIITDYCAKGSLYDIVENEDIKLDNMFIASLVFDLIKGMLYLHKSILVCHGNLKSSNCVVTSRWVLQITDFGIHELRHCAESDSIGEHQHFRSLFWKAPELLREGNVPLKGTQKGDIYAFAIILYEIIGRRGPFGICDYEPKEIIDRVKQHPKNGMLPFRPDLSLLEESSFMDSGNADYVLNCIEECWAENPDTRPDFATIRSRLRKMRDGMQSNIMDQMMDIMEKHADNLENLVAERTRQLFEEKRKTEDLLHRMLPAPVAQRLTKGFGVEPESFDLVTIYFSDIVGFTAMSAESTPLQVVNFLNDLYTLFDRIIKGYDVYKVETIGDAYMVVSGLPLRNEDKHVGEIASMSLDLLEAVKNHQIAHRPNDVLKLRIGIHTGPVVAGVVGLTMPRYCLFGDTVNTASRMESNGEPLKIHISEQCNAALEKLGGYIVEERGLVYMKGKGEVRTYWLKGATDQAIQRREVDLNELPPLFCRPRRSPKLYTDSRHASICGAFGGAGSRRQSSVPRENSLDVESASALHAFAAISNTVNSSNSSPLLHRSQRSSSKRADRSPLYLNDVNGSRTTLSASALGSQSCLSLDNECLEDCGNRTSFVQSHGEIPLTILSTPDELEIDRRSETTPCIMRESRSLDPFPDLETKGLYQPQLSLQVPKRSSRSLENCMGCSGKIIPSKVSSMDYCHIVNNNFPNGDLILGPTQNNNPGLGSSTEDIQTPLLRNGSDHEDSVLVKRQLKRGKSGAECLRDFHPDKKWRSMEEMPGNNVTSVNDQNKKLIARSSIRSWLVGLFNGNGLRTSDASLRKGIHSGYSDLQSEKESIV